MNSYLSPRLMMGAAIVGLVGAAGMFLYEQVYAEKRRAMLLSEVARLDKQVSSMRTELEALRELQKETRNRNESESSRVRLARRVKAKPRVRREVTPAGDATDSEYYTDCHSLVGTDIEFDSEEFYDVPSDEEDTLKESIKNGVLTSSESLEKDTVQTPPLKPPRTEST
ncbi:uncharacterized protein LOC123717472 isoform X1 [Pieris brassicae]|uniref:Regulator of microtubule dynamics protein 3 n=1 Tax=Pieris brassicae TaxID=7116 RepID=A0A9P0XF45_PIEBR|nr:uncharacterized protein LOC123717472 isoform X1 [Pieris brassicae]CAH4032425.1 unnamed protein product [Pieris brassicae]